jgi:hypothetical protein
MEKIFLSLFLFLILFPVSSGFSQVTDTKPTLSIELNSSPYVYHDKDGYTIVVGSIKNTNSLTTVTNVQIRATFYDDVNVAPLEIVRNSTVLQAIPPLGTSPYMIKSKTPNPQITQATVFVEKFDSSAAKSKLLSIQLSDILAHENLVFSGVIKNGPAPSSGANVYVAFYDAFDPPRILEVSTIHVGDMKPNEQIPFAFDSPVNPSSVGFKLFSESDVFYSDFVNVKIPEPVMLDKLVTISDVSVTDLLGNSLSEIKLGSTVKIQSNSVLEFSSDNDPHEIPYTYYVQVKEAGDKPYVEFIGKYDGRYLKEGSQIQSIDWIPEKEGLFFIETFVWDRSNIPIADHGPVAIIMVKQ